MRAIFLSSLLSLGLLSVPAAAQQDQPIQDGEDILTEDVLESGVTIEPDQQGMREPEPVDEEERVDLYAVLQRLRQAPPGLDGAPVPRPNAWASEPETEMEPLQPREAVLFPDDYSDNYVE